MVKDRMRPRHDLTPEVVINRLRSRFGIPNPPPGRPPVDELICTILSQNTSDRNRDRAFRSLKDRFPTWGMVLDSSVGELEEVIAPAGLGPTKSKRIWDILHSADTLDALERICEHSREDGLALLTGLKGVGPKTAACVLLFSCGVPAFPVDTHVFRVAGRLGILDNGEDRVRAHAVLEGYFDSRDYLEGHLNIIKLGRVICRPRRPLCQECPLADYCPSFHGGGRSECRLGGMG